MCEPLIIPLKIQTPSQKMLLENKSKLLQYNYN